MKKRNQLVSALLAGMLLSGIAVTTAHADPQTASTKTAAEAAAAPSAAEDTNTNTAAQEQETGTQREAPAASESSQAEAQSESGESAAASSTEESASSEKSTTETQENSSKEESSSESTASVTPSAALAETPGATAAPTTTPSANTTTPAAAETPAPTTTPSANTTPSTTVTPTPATPSSNTNTTAPSVKPAAPAAAETPAPTAKPAARSTTPAANTNKAKSDTNSTSAGKGSSSAASSNPAAQRAFSTAINSLVSAPTVTNTQQSDLQDGFVQIAKKYALANIGANQVLNIRESASESGRVIGTLQNGGLCFVITDDDKDWVYIESGDVRGFVQKKYLLEGAEARQKIKAAGGEDKFEKAKVTVDPKENTAYRYSLYTTQELDTDISANRQEMINYAMQYLGRPYVWGGEDLWNGSDCSGFVRGIYAKFGISLPRTSAEQSQAGMKVDAKDVKPGDLLFYSRGGTVYHVLMYIGNGQAINAQSSATGVVISNVNYSKVCWGCRYINDEETTSTQAASLTAVGQKAYQGNSDAQKQIIDALAKAADEEWDKVGLARSVVIAQAIQESGWLSFQNSANGGIQATDNNVLGMKENLADNNWVTPWKLTAADRNVPQVTNGQTVMGRESMRTYSDIESSMEDYAAYTLSQHPDLKNSLDVDAVVNEGLKGYSTDASYQTTIRSLIDKYNLTQYDSQPVAQSANTVFKSVDKTNYTAEQLQLIWAIVGQEDDSSYEGALAVISSAMNRADVNLGGYGTNALSQLTAPSQYAYSVGNPAYYQRRLNGNVPDYVKEAVSDCLTKGARNHSYLSFRSTNGAGGRTQIGGNWYF